MDRSVEALGVFRNEIEYRRGIGREADRVIGGCENLRRGHSANINQAISKGLAKARQQFDVAMAVFESDQMGTLIRQPSHRVEFEQAIVRVVDDDGDSDSAADCYNMAVKPFLLRLDEIVRQQQNAVRAAFSARCAN
jgi:hypothetical protein